MSLQHQPLYQTVRIAREIIDATEMEVRPTRFWFPACVLAAIKSQEKTFMQMNLTDLRAWMVSMIGIAEIRAVRAPRGDSGLGSDIGTAIPDVSPEDSTGTVSGDEQRWARIVTQDGTNPNAAGEVEVKVVKWGTGGPVSEWISPDAVPAFVGN